MSLEPQKAGREGFGDFGGIEHPGVLKRNEERKYLEGNVNIGVVEYYFNTAKMCYI